MQIPSAGGQLCDELVHRGRHPGEILDRSSGRALTGRHRVRNRADQQNASRLGSLAAASRLKCCTAASVVRGNTTAPAQTPVLVARADAATLSARAAAAQGGSETWEPKGGERHVNYSRRAMVADQVEVMRTLGFDRFAVVGHDRGGRVAHRMALDHPDAVEWIAVLDIAPTATMYAQTNKEFATRYIWWFFLIQPAPLPERLIGADPEFCLRTHIEGQSKRLGSTSEVLFRGGFEIGIDGLSFWLMRIAREIGRGTSVQALRE